VAKICLYHEPIRQAHGPEVLEGSANHHECNYEPGGDMCAIRVTSAQDRICLDYFCRIGVNCKVAE